MGIAPKEKLMSKQWNGLWTFNYCFLYFFCVWIHSESMEILKLKHVSSNGHRSASCAGWTCCYFALQPPSWLLPLCFCASWNKELHLTFPLSILSSVKYCFWSSLSVLFFLDLDFAWRLLEICYNQLNAFFYILPTKFTWWNIARVIWQKKRDLISNLFS